MEKENKITPKDMICNTLFNLSVNLSWFNDKIIIPKAWNIWYLTPVLKEESSVTESKSFNKWAPNAPNITDRNAKITPILKYLFFILFKFLIGAN